MWHGAGLLVLGAALLVLSQFPPTETPWYPKCVLHEVPGLHCPGCGTARAVFAMLHGQLFQALAYNPFAVFAVAWLAWEMLSRAVCHLVGWRRPLPPVWTVWLFVGLLILYGLVRNIPVEPFQQLAPRELTAEQ